jgi:two-component system sensor histidine kinase ChiS
MNTGPRHSRHFKIFLALPLLLLAWSLPAQANLEAWNPVLSQPLSLDQGWLFVWNQFLDPPSQNDTAIAQFQKDTRPLRPGWRWTTHLDGYPDLPMSGFGTYLLKIHLPPSRNDLLARHLSLEIGKVSSSARIYWNGALIGAFGSPNRTAAATRSLMNTGIFELPLPDDPAIQDLWLAVQVANFTDNYPGLQTIPRLGPRERLEQDRDLSIATTFVMAGLFLIMGIYHLFLFLFRRDERAPLYFAFICLLLAIRILVTDQLFVMIPLPEFPLSMVWAIGYLTFTLLLAAFAFFTTNLFRYSWSPVIRWVAVGGSALYSILIVTTDSLFYIQFMEIFQVFCLSVGLALAALIVTAIAGRRQHAALFAIGLFIVLGTTVFDILKTDLQWPYPSLVPVGMVAFVFVLALVLTRRSSQNGSTNACSASTVPWSALSHAASCNWPKNRTLPKSAWATTDPKP